ncbi:MAG: CCA tRNA nucleotidyltransferase [Phycisphaerales bacterium]
MSDAPRAQAAAERIARELREAGYIAYFAGGCVRDQLLGYVPKDFDIATDARPDVIRALFKRTHDVGVAFGVVLVRLMDVSVEVTTFRAEGSYSDHRRPDAIVYADAESDAQRRDFTINGMFRDPATSEVIDLVGGRADLESGIIRAIGDADARFEEDHLRMLRAVRFAARFNFNLEPATENAIRMRASQLRGISRERIGQEIAWMLSHPTRARAVALIESLGLDQPTLLESSMQCERRLLSALPEDADVAFGLAAWWLDRHGVRGNDDDDDAASLRSWRSAMVLSNDVFSRTKRIIQLQKDIITHWNQWSVARRRRVMGEADAVAALTIARLHAQQQGNTVLDAALAHDAHPAPLPQPLLNGDTLMKSLRIGGGPRIGSILEAVFDAQLEERIETENEAIELARSMLADDGDIA